MKSWVLNAWTLIVWLETTSGEDLNAPSYQHESCSEDFISAKQKFSRLNLFRTVPTMTPTCRHSTDNLGGGAKFEALCSLKRRDLHPCGLLMGWMTAKRRRENVKASPWRSSAWPQVTSGSSLPHLSKWLVSSAHFCWINLRWPVARGALAEHNNRRGRWGGGEWEAGGEICLSGLNIIYIGGRWWNKKYTINPLIIQYRATLFVLPHFTSGWCRDSVNTTFSKRKTDLVFCFGEQHFLAKRNFENSFNLFERTRTKGRYSNWGCQISAFIAINWSQT